MAKAKGASGAASRGSTGKKQNNSTSNGPTSVKDLNKENDTANSTQRGKGRVSRDKPKIINDDPKQPESPGELSLETIKAEKELMHPKVQPTTEQLMIAKMIDHSDDPHQRKKIQQVMDVTGKPEDEVATALFDAGWDESRAVELLLEDGDHLTAWEETGKKKKGKKQEDKDDFDESENQRDNNRGQRGPPRMRRGGSNANRDHRRGGPEMTENGDQVVPKSRDGFEGGRGGRRGDQPPRRGGRGGGGRTFSTRQQTNGASSGPNGPQGSGFQGSIDTWANPNDPNAGDRQAEGERQGGERGGRRRGGRGGSQTGKDAFDNAGNWGDDFPNADEWDNEEYTGSLADTKVRNRRVFTASGGGERGKPRRGDDSAPQPVGANSQQQQQQQQRGGYGLTSNGPTSYSQSIDLSTLLQKPTTQSSVGSAAPGAQFNQQATDTLKAVVGIGQNQPQSQTQPQPANPKDNLYSSYAQASAFTSITKKNNSSKASQAVGGPRTQGRTSSKAPAVEMPGDSLGRLDVQFGGLDLQFGANSANSESGLANYEFDDKSKTKTTESFAPTAKEVNKSLSNALTSGGKLQTSSNNTAAVVPTTGDSFSKQATTTANSTSASAQNFNAKQADLNSGYYNNYKGYNQYNQQQYQQYPNSNNFTSASSNSGSGNSSGTQQQYKGQFDKYDPQMNNPAAAVLGLANTNTTNALSGKVSATTASKVNMPNLPPGVASMLHPQYVAAAGLAPAAFYGLQQPMYGAYGNAGLDDLAAIAHQRASASAAGLHTLPTTGYYDPNNQFAATSALPREAGNTNTANLNSLITTSPSTSSSATLSSGFGSNSQNSANTTTSNDSNSSPGPNQSSVSVSSANSSSGVQQMAQQQQQQQQQQTAFNLATNAFAQQMPPGYAYYFGNMGNMPSLQPYGATTGHVYQPTMTVPGAGATAATSQFQKSYGTSYGSGYDTLGQQGNKDFSSNYSSNGQSKSTGGSAAAGSGKGAHQYWGNTLTSTQLW